MVEADTGGGDCLGAAAAVWVCLSFGWSPATAGGENSLTLKQKWLQPMLGWQYCNPLMQEVPDQDKKKKMEYALNWKRKQVKSNLN